jgi:hypothetical protein
MNMNDNTEVNMEELIIWTIYHNPSDYPGKYVARKFAITKDIVPTRDMFIADSLEEIRAMLPPNLYCTSPLPGDDPVIVEVWL